MSSRSVSLTSTFLLLAAGGAAACDRNRYHNEGFYCADANGVIVDESYCDANHSYGGGVVPYYIWHSSGYRSGYPIGARLPAGGRLVYWPIRLVTRRPGSIPSSSTSTLRASL